MTTNPTRDAIIAETAADCARCALSQGLTAGHLADGWDVQQGDLDALDEALDSRATDRELRLFKHHFAVAVHDAAPEPAPIVAGDGYPAPALRGARAVSASAGDPAEEETCQTKRNQSA